MSPKAIMSPVDADSAHIRRLRWLKWGIFVLLALLLAAVEAYYCFAWGVPLAKGVVNWILGTVGAGLVVELGFRLVENLHRRFQQETAERARAEADRRRAEEALQESEDRLRTIVAGAPIVLFAVDPEGTITLIDGRGLGTLGVEPDELIGRSVFDVLQDAPHVGECVRRALAGEEFTTAVELAGRTFEAWFSPLRDHNGGTSADEIVGLIGVATDITARVEAEEELRESRRLLEMTLARLRDAVFIVDTDTVEIVECNPAALEMFGYSRQEMIGRTTTFLHVDEATLEEFRRHLNHAVEEKGFLYLPEFRMRREDGTVFDTEHSVVPLKDEDGACVAWVSVVRDITQRVQTEAARRRAQEALQASEERYRGLFDGVPVGLYRSTPDGRMLDANLALVQLLGYPDRDCLLRVHADELYVNPGDRGRWQILLECAGAVRDFEVQLRRHDGMVIWARSTARVHRDAEGRVSYYEGSLEDITARRRTEESLARRTAQLLLINEISRRIAVELDLDELMHRATSLVQKNFDYHHVALFTVDREQEQVVLRAVAGHRAARVLQVYRQELNEGIVGWTAAHGATQLINDVRADSRYIQGFADAMMTRSELCVPIKAGSEMIGVLDIQSPQCNAFDESDVIVMETLADQIAVAMESAQLFDRVQASRRRLRQLTQQIVSAQEEERRRLSRELHDEAGQALTALKIGLELVRADLPAEADSLRQRLGEAVSLTDATMEQIRLLAQDLRPPALDTVGLAPTLEGVCQEFSERTGLSVDYVADIADLGTPSTSSASIDRASAAELLLLGDAVNTCLYRFLQEALTNVAKHADATQIQVVLRYDGRMIRLSVEDDGKGFDTRAGAAPSHHGRGIGLVGMRERIELLDGWLEVKSRPKQGTRLVAHIPCREVE